MTDVELWNSQVILRLGCGRAYGTLQRKRRHYYCLTGEFLKIEADLRGLPSPPANASFGSLKRDPNNAAL